jgi:hypothetical protein
MVAVAQAAAEAGVPGEGPGGAVDVEGAVRGGRAGVDAGQLEQLVAVSRSTRDISLSSPARLAKPSSASAGRALLAWSRTRAKSTPRLEARAISRSVDGSTSVAQPPSAVCHSPWT